MHIHAARLFKHRNTSKCNRATERQNRRWGVDMAARCDKMEFNMYREEGGKLVEGVANFKYMRLNLDQMDYYWPSVW